MSKSVKMFTFLGAVWLSTAVQLIITSEMEVQLGSSSRAKHGGAYFSAVFGRNFNPTTVLRPCQPLACYWGVGIAPAPTLFTTSTKHHGSR